MSLLLETTNGFFFLNQPNETLPILKVSDGKQYTAKTKFKAPFVAQETPVKDIQSGDYLLIPRKYSWGERSEVSESFAQTLGYLYSSGVTKCQARQEPFSEILFRFSDEESLKTLGEKIGQKLSPKMKSAWYPLKKVDLRAGFREEEVSEIMGGLEGTPFAEVSPIELLGVLDCKNSLPDFIMDAPKSVVCAFLRTLIEHDAMIHPERSVTSVKFYLRNESPLVLHQVRLLLLKLGVVTALLEKPSIGFSIKNMGYLKKMWSELGIRRELPTGQGEIFFYTPIYAFRWDSSHKWGAPLKQIAENYHSEMVLKVTPFREVGSAQGFENLIRTYPLIEEMYVPRPPKPMPKRSSDEWMREWVGMPEFVQEKVESYAKINFQFPDEESLMKFSEVIEQRLTTRTKSAWFPELMRGSNRYKRWCSREP
jgi:hypothetical protein